MVVGEKELAIKNYEKSVERIENEGGIGALEEVAGQ